MKAIHLFALAASLALAACRSATTTASLAPAGPAPALVANAPDSLPVALARGLQEPAETFELEEVEELPEPSGWHFAISPYAFFAGVNGTVEVRDQSGDLDADFRDLLDSLNFGAMVGLEVGHSDSSWKGLVDLIYISLEDDGKSQTGDPADATMDQFVGELAAGLELQPDGLVDLLFGARFWSVSADVSVDLGPPTGVVSADGSETWVDPVIGLRSRLPLGSNLDVLLRGDVGGFGLGSEFSSHFSAGLDWAFAESFSLGAGFRQLYVNYDQSDFVYDVKFGGPYLGLTWRL